MRRKRRSWVHRRPVSRTVVKRRAPNDDGAVAAVPAHAGGDGSWTAGPPTGRAGEVLLFMTTHAALRGEDALLDAGLEVDVVPKPEGVRGLCGIALEVPAAMLGRATTVLEAGGIPFEVYEESNGARGT